MKIKSLYDGKSKTLNLYLNGCFDYQSNGPFSEAYSKEAEHYVLNMKDVTYMDASALGILLLFKDHVEETSNISIVGCSSDIYSLFISTKFNLLFNISQ